MLSYKKTISLYMQKIIEEHNPLCNKIYTRDSMYHQVLYYHVCWTILADSIRITDLKLVIINLH